jgi:FkbM family methyltransferase
VAGIEQSAFRGLLVCRHWMRRIGVDRVVRRHSRLASALRSAYRFLYQTFDPSGLITVEAGGYRISAESQQRDLALILLGKEWEERQTRLFESLLGPGMVFVDVGAHIGYYTLLGAHRVGPRGRVYAFEPAPENFRVLKRNISQNGLSNVVAEAFAVAGRSGRAQLTISDSDSASHSLAGSLASGQKVEVETTSLDEYFADNDTRIDVVKLDAEGAEPEILEGMQQLLARNPAAVLFVEIYPRAMEALGGSPEAFLARLRQLGFALVPFDEKRAAEHPLEPDGFASFLDDLRAQGTGTNLICRRESVACVTGLESKTARPGSPLVSIAIPTYNRGELLERTLESILPELADDFEVVICDTGSTDGTRERIAPIAAANPRVRFFSLAERLNLDEALLRLLDLSRGEYVWFFSSDDRMKPGAAEEVRQRIFGSRRPPALVYVNQEILGEDGRTLIASQAGRERDRDFADGRGILPWLGLNLGFLSASVIPLASARQVTSARDFAGTRSLNLHLYLECLRRGGPALYIGKPLIQVRRASGAPPYEYRDVFVRDIVRILSHARRTGFGWLRIYRAMNRIAATQYLRLVVSWRADDPAELSRAFPAMCRACWMVPAFWLLLVPACLAPRALVRGVRNRLRDRRNNYNRRNERIDTAEAEPFSSAGCVVSDPNAALPWPFRSLLRARRMSASWSADRVFKSVPFLIAAYRSLYAQLCPKREVRTEFRGHALHLDLADQTVARSLVTTGAWERYETQVFAKAVRQDMVVVDIGANIGQYTLEAARRVGTNGTVFAFEPEPHNFELLCRNITANGYRNVVPVRKALSNRCGTLRLAIDADNLGGHHFAGLSETDQVIDVETTSLDAFLRENPTKIELIKIDAEGAELSILEGMSGALTANPDLIIFTEYMPRAIGAFGGRPASFLETLAAAGFSLGIVEEETEQIEPVSLGRLEEITLSLMRETRGRFHVNLLCLRGRFARESEASFGLLAMSAAASGALPAARR